MLQNTIINESGWIKTTEFSVGGLLWIGFSKKQTNKLICISSEYASVVNCDTGEIAECDAEYDEEQYTAVCERLGGEEIAIYGQYGGSPILATSAGENIRIQVQEELYAGKVVKRYKIFWNTSESSVEIYNDYGYYVCSFSVCGNYFVLAEDAGMMVYRRG